MNDNLLLFYKEIWHIDFRDKLAERLAHAEGQVIEYQVDRDGARALWKARATVAIQEFAAYLERLHNPTSPPPVVALDGSGERG